MAHEISNSTKSVSPGANAPRRAPKAEIPPFNNDDRRAFRVNDAVRVYGVSRSSLYNLMASGELTTVKIAGRRLIPRDAIEALLQA